MEDRIKLADAMGVEYWRSEVYGDAIGVPDPFTDANDDYAVLEYYRNMSKNNIDRVRFMDKLFYTNTSMGRCMSAYKIGDYARAALKVLGD